MSSEQELDVAEGEMKAAERHMDSATRSYLRSLSETREALDAYRVEIEEEREDPQARAEEKELEREIRAGKHGPALKALQERIDKEETSMLDVLSGEDEHWSADGLRDAFGPVLEAAAAEVAAEDTAHDQREGGESARRRRIDDKGTW